MKSIRIGFLVLWVLLFLIGGVAVFERFTLGDQLANLTSYVPWGLWVAAYVYFIGLSAGTFLLSSLVYGFGMKRLEPIGKFALFSAIATLLMALVMIWFDIGHPFRATEIFTRPQFHSMMTWMVWLYTGYFILLLAELAFAIRLDYAGWKDDRSFLRSLLARLLLLRRAEQSSAVLERNRLVLRTLAILGIPLAVAFHGGVGALFATVAAQEIWHNPLYPLLFLSGALLSGGALLTALVSFFWPNRDTQWHEMISYLGRITLVLILLYALFEWAEYSVPLWYGVGNIRDLQALNAVLFGQFWYVFWIFHVLLGLVLPVALLFLAPRRPFAVGLAGALVAITFMAVRLNMVIPAFVEPQLQGLSAAYIDSRLTFQYFPAFFEWQLLVFVVTIGLAIFYLGYRLLPLMPATPSNPARQKGRLT